MNEISEMTDNQLDEAVAREVMGLEIERRYCAINPECGNWEEAQEVNEDLISDGYGTPEFIEHMKRILEDDSRKRWCYKDDDGIWNVVPEYSSDGAEVWHVVDRMRDLGYRIFKMEIGDWYRETYDVTFGNYVHGSVASANTAPRAICEAALEAVRSSRE